ncbi:hypothetical protein psyc5s11_19060 [Clostridium gelidum]|uniref:Uncharacterized protein n=1 Tax=Clostridium gelidum TaxID=704125 RepID=A0ABN6IZL2_9CLOT|nr:hypothetical protein psyc5s11_19060 [Clostridium gelidum]
MFFDFSFSIPLSLNIHDYPLSNSKLAGNYDYHSNLMLPLSLLNNIENLHHL